MNYDEFAFFNQQLATMLRDGIPLEGALKQLSAGMRAGALRTQIEQLESDLEKGAPLKEALAHRSLPPFYVRMVEIGARSNDLPAMLTLLADYYQRTNALLTRLKGLMIYPLIVITVALGLTLGLSFALGNFITHSFTELFNGNFSGVAAPRFLLGWLWVPPICLTIAALAILAAIYIPGLRGRLRWRLPAFREASLAQLASAIGLMLKNGVPLPEALALAEMLETETPAADTLTHWRSLVADGKGKPAQWSTSGHPFPQLFLWLIQSGGEDPASGFQKAAEVYQARASYRIEMALYGALPVSILLLGQMVLWEAMPLFRSLITLMNMLGNNDGGGPV
jgi:type II secretory pathway component PulF